MPDYVRAEALNRLKNSSWLKDILEHFSSLGVQIKFSEAPPSPEEESVEFDLGNVTLGYFIIGEATSRQQQTAAAKILEYIVNEDHRPFADEHHKHHHSPLPWVVNQAATIIREKFRDNIRLTEVAREVKITPERLSKLFHQHLGIPYNQYLNRVRIEHAKKSLLGKDHKIADIAFDSGFQSISQFNRRFKASEGLSPRQYRVQHFEG